jgi:hypothetical protein
MLVYLAGPIDLVNGEQRNEWRERFARELTGRNISSFNPASAFNYTPGDRKTARQLIDINKAAMFACDFAVVVMGRDMPSVGTPIELKMLSDINMPHVVVWEPAMESFDDIHSKRRIKPTLPAYVQGLADKVVYRFDDAISALIEWDRRNRDIIKPGVTIAVDGIHHITPQ